MIRNFGKITLTLVRSSHSGEDVTGVESPKSCLVSSRVTDSSEVIIDNNKIHPFCWRERL